MYIYISYDIYIYIMSCGCILLLLEIALEANDIVQDL